MKDKFILPCNIGSLVHKYLKFLTFYSLYICHALNTYTQKHTHTHTHTYTPVYIHTHTHCPMKNWELNGEFLLFLVYLGHNVCLKSIFLEFILCEGMGEYWQV